MVGWIMVYLKTGARDYGDPMRKEVGMVRKKIDMANRDIKSLAQSCQKKVLSEYVFKMFCELCSSA